MTLATALVLLPNSLPHGFDYAVPEGMTLSAGDYVSVPFGSREMVGVVWGAGVLRGKEAERAISPRSGAPSEKQYVSQGAQFKLKSITHHHPHLPPLSEAMRKFIDWAAWYTFAPKGAVLKMLLPVAEAVKLPSNRERSSLSAHVGVAHPPHLSAAQTEAAELLAGKLGHGFSTTLLDGVTGSGKTEVYFDSIARVIADGAGQALVMLPEISLSIQWLERFEARFGFQPLVWHSGISPAQRKHSWRAIVNGEARVVVGARSSLFLPYANLRLMVVDEEHDGSYKQEEGVMYHARDMAVARARFENIPLVLASATPSIETYANVKNGRYAEAVLPARHGGAQLPAMHLVDMRKTPLERGAFLSTQLRENIAGCLASGHQAMLFLNRRGYAPLLLCRACGFRFQCPECTSWMVLHKRGKGQVAGGRNARQGGRVSPEPASCDLQEANHGGILKCHHCSYSIPEPKHCPECKASDAMMACGPGVERIAEEVEGLFPQARIEVLASDATESHAELQARIHAMQAGSIDILIGTQMMAKGHHFAGLALVGVVDADLGLSGGDLRAAERTWQLLHQISGRAGRAKTAGHVLIQSFAPEHPVMQALISGDRERFMQLQLAEREKGHMPPFSRLAAIIVESPKEELAAALAKSLARAAPKLKEVQVLGPSSAPLYMLRGKYRQRLLVRAEKNVNMQAVLAAWLTQVKAPHNVRVKVDVDPYSFM